MYRKRKSLRQVMHAIEHIDNGDIELAKSLLVRLVEEEKRRQRKVEGGDKVSKENVFPLPLDARFVGNCQWRLLAPFIYDNSPIKIEVPIGFVTDGKSIPKIAWSVIGSPWSGESPKAAVPHDWGYHTQTKSRKEVDKDFIDGMEILGVPLWKRRIMYRMVRMFSWICWRKKKKKIGGK